MARGPMAVLVPGVVMDPADAKMVSNRAVAPVAAPTMATPPPTGTCSSRQCFLSFVQGRVPPRAVDCQRTS